MSTADPFDHDLAEGTVARKQGRPSDLAKREAILEAASDLFLAGGFAAASIEQVAADAGVSKVTIYNHFGDKRGLFSAAVERECEKMRGVFALDAAPSGTTRERLTIIGEAMLAFLTRDEMIRFDHRIAAETEYDPAIGLAFLEAGPWRMKETFSQWLRLGCEAGELDIQDTKLAAEQFVAMIKGLGHLERRFGMQGDAQADARRIAGAVDVFLKTYGVHKP